MRNLIFHVHKEPWQQQGVKIYGLVEGNSGRRQELTDVVVTTVQDGALATPFLQLEDRSAQILFDELYRIGLRPSREAEERQAAADEHIADLRAIAFKLLEIDTVTMDKL